MSLRRRTLIAATPAWMALSPLARAQAAERPEKPRLTIAVGGKRTCCTTCR